MPSCPLCGLEIDQNDLTRHYLSDVRIIRRIKAVHPKWKPEDGACARCLEANYQEVSIKKSLLDDEITEERTVITAAEQLISPTEENTSAAFITLHGLNLGKKYDLPEGESIIGRAEGVGIRVNEENVSRQHAKVFKAGSEVIIEDLDSTNGTFVNTKKITSQPIKDGDLVLVGNTILKFATGTDIENRYHDEIYRLATVDGLTQVHNKSFFLERVADEFARSKRYRRDLSVIFFDLDHFKKLNDTFGHLAGDEVLRRICNIIVQNLRKEDPVGRYGGEEFAILLPETPKEKALSLAEKIRKMVERADIRYENKEIKTTISLGVASITPEVDNVRRFIEIADQALYRAKGAGRNCVSD